MIANIAEDLLPLAFPIEKLRLLPGNPKRGNVEEVAKSYEAYGQLKPIVVRKDSETDEGGTVLAGNTQLQASRKLEWTHIAVVWADSLDDKKAIGFALADNSTADMGTYDTENLIEKIEFVMDDPDIYTGYDNDNLNDFYETIKEDEIILPSFSGDDDDDDSDLDPPTRVPGNPVVQYAIIFDDDDQQQVWFKFIRWLKQQYPDKETVAERLTYYLETFVEFDD